MSILRVSRRNSYTTMDNTAINDERLGFKEVGLLIYLLSKPDGWTVNFRHLATTHDDGEYAVRKGLAKLEECGYLVRHKEHDPDSGEWVNISEVHEIPLEPGDRVAKTAARCPGDRVAVTRVAVTATHSKEGDSKEPPPTPLNPPRQVGHLRVHEGEGEIETAFDTADRLTKVFLTWVNETDQPVPSVSHAKIRKLVKDAVERNWPDTLIAEALERTKTWTTGGLEFALNAVRQAGTRIAGEVGSGPVVPLGRGPTLIPGCTACEGGWAVVEMPDVGPVAVPCPTGCRP